MDLETPNNILYELENESSTIEENPEETARINRNQHLKIDNPKKFQFTARATQQDADRITNALRARKTATGRKHDIVTLTIAMLNYLEADILQTFKTK